MSDDLREKLRRLGLSKGIVHLKSWPRPLDPLLNGREIETAHGAAYVIEKQFDLHYAHGDYQLAAALDMPGEALALLAYGSVASPINLARTAFLDTETSGLAGGTGTFVFMIGVGRFDSRRSTFNTSQFFLRQPDEEQAMLTALSEMLTDCEAVITFNGRGFDIPLLQTRFTLNRMVAPALTAPNIDLLLPARRIWRDHLPSCALASLEAHVLGVYRDQADIPSYLIPQMYFDYLRSGDAAEMPRVLHHNLQDILSLTTLLARLGRLLTDQADETLDAAELVSLGRWYADLRLDAQAEAAWRRALERPLPPHAEAAACKRLGFLLKRQERYSQAIPLWERLATVESDVTAHIELAKHYEWREHNWAKALEWTQAALERLKTLPSTPAREQTRAELTRRKKRLESKRIL